MIRSIRQFLLISLLVSITIASSITAVGNYLLDKQVIQPYLDHQLIKIFEFLEVLDQSPHKSQGIQERILRNIKQTGNVRSLLFQIWSQKNVLLIDSPSAYSKNFRDSPIGFSNMNINGSDWRLYTEIDTVTHNKIVVAELQEIRNQLADNITENNAYILLVTYPLFGILIWIIVGIALRSITRVSNEISNRALTFLEPVNPSNIPVEIKPLVDELNQLFVRLKLAFDRNKRFAGDAAHELRTPLAALKTQAQVALRSENSTERSNALLKVIQGVDRSTHIVAQLLTLSRLNQEDALNDIKWVDLHKLTTEIVAYLVPVALEKQIEIELAPLPIDSVILGNDIALGILIRNIVDNAIRYTPQNGEVKIQIITHPQHIILRVTDSGPGVPVELRERIFERFYRILGTTASGSGLGLAIVSQITELHHAHISLSTPPRGMGLQFDVAFQRQENK